jgi:hypothetical protein
MFEEIGTCRAMQTCHVSGLLEEAEIRRMFRDVRLFETRWELQAGGKMSPVAVQTKMISALCADERRATILNMG